MHFPLALIVILISEYMPVGLYTRKGANGRRMYFRDGKLISKQSYTASRNRRGASRKGRAPYRGKRSTGNTRRKMRKNFDLNIVDTASALLITGGIVNAFDFVGSGKNTTPEFKKGMWGAGLSELGMNMRNPKVQKYVAKVALGALAVKGAAKALKVRKIGGIKNIFSLTV